MALKEAIEIVAQRGEEYNGQREGFWRTAKMWSALFGIPVTAEQVVLAMILNKVSRESMSHKYDNLVDIAGYAEVLDIIRSESGKEFALITNMRRMTDGEVLDNIGQGWAQEEAVRRFMERV